VQTRSERTAEEWCQNSDAASEMKARPEGNGFDLSAINAEGFLQARESFGLFDEWMKSAQHALVWFAKLPRAVNSNTKFPN
jgi:hypothetical protein